MKLFVIALLVLQFTEYNSADRDELFRKIGEQESILKSELEKTTGFTFKRYEEKFYGSGSFIKSGNIRAGILDGIRNDTLHNIAIVFKGEQCVYVKEQPYASISRKDRIISEQYRLGRLYNTYKDGDTSCIVVHFEAIEPYHVEVLKEKFNYNQATVTMREAVEFCK